MSVSLDTGLLARIDESRGLIPRAAWLREAAEAMLHREAPGKAHPQKQKAIHEALQTVADMGPQEILEQLQTTEAQLAELRKARDAEHGKPPAKPTSCTFSPASTNAAT